MKSKSIAIMAMLVSSIILLSGCCITPPADNGVGMGQSYQTGSGNGNGGQIAVVHQNDTGGGMSDPSKCNNLPPQQMADCLSRAMGN